MDTFMLHLISHRPKEALQRLEKMAEGGGMEIEAGGVPTGFQLCFVCATLKCMPSYIGLNHTWHKKYTFSAAVDLTSLRHYAEVLPHTDEQTCSLLSLASMNVIMQCVCVHAGRARLSQAHAGRATLMLTIRIT